MYELLGKICENEIQAKRSKIQETHDMRDWKELERLSDDNPQ